jgi:sulfide dehydrogenase cytochrome subunit
MKIRFALCLLLFSGGSAVAQATDTALLIGGCQGCHGASGQGGNGIPSMRAFSANERPATIMDRISRGYTPEQIALLAAHYARPQ